MVSVSDVSQRKLERVVAKYEGQTIDDAYLALYEGQAASAFASIHERLDAELRFMNYKARNGASGHFNADNSRNLLDLIDEVDRLRTAFTKAGQRLMLNAEYERVLKGSSAWLVPSGGSLIPQGFTPIVVEEYEAVFTLADATTSLQAASVARLDLEGEGAFAFVYKYIDPNYGVPFAKKKLKKGADEREKDRFRKEFDLMKSLRSPYILQVYKFDAAEYAYTMEYCESTLEKYVNKRHSQKKFTHTVRKRVALQMLFGIAYLHHKGHCHRDLSCKNVLLREFDAGAVTVKLSDFGLVKEYGSEYTKTETEIKGTIIDPALDKFGSFKEINDIYAVGFLLAFIFTGKKRLPTSGSPLADIIAKCTRLDVENRYQNINEIIRAVEKLDPVTIESK